MPYRNSKLTQLLQVPPDSPAPTVPPQLRSPLAPLAAAM